MEWQKGTDSSCELRHRLPSGNRAVAKKKYSCAVGDGGGFLERAGVLALRRMLGRTCSAAGSRPEGPIRSAEQGWLARRPKMPGCG